MVEIRGFVECTLIPDCFDRRAERVTSGEDFQVDEGQAEQRAKGGVRDRHALFQIGDFAALAPFFRLLLCIS